MSQDIADFLRARYAEQRGRELAKRREREDAPLEYEIIRDWEDAYVRIGPAGAPRRPRVSLEEFQQRYTESAPDPMVLADLDAKERLLEWSNWPGGGPDSRDAYEYALAEMARPFAGHPDHREEWRP
jgi:hypothetical protein